MKKHNYLLSNIYSVFITLALFGLVYGGIYKAILSIFEINFLDLTIVSFVSLVILLLIGPRLLIPIASFRYISIMSIFCILYIGSYFYSVSSIYAPQKLFAFMGVIFSFIVGVLLPFKYRKLFIESLPYFAIVSAIGYIWIFLSNFDPLKLYILSSSGLVIGEALGLSALALAIKKKKTFLNYFLIALCFLIMLGVGARGPFIFTLVLYFFYFVYLLLSNQLQIKTSDFFSILAIVLLTFFLVIAFSGTQIFDLWESGIFRFLLLFEDGKGASIDSRTYLITTSWDFIGKAPFFGYGLGSFGIVVNGIDERAYPHNGFLEVWFEAGLISLLVFIMLVISAIYRSFIQKQIIIVFALIFIILNFLKSSSIDEVRVLFLFLGFAANLGFKKWETKN